MRWAKRTLPLDSTCSKTGGCKNSASLKRSRKNWRKADGSSTSRTRRDQGRTRRDLESVSKAMRTGQLDHATFVGWVYRGMHVKIQRHPSRNDEMDTLLVGRRHPAPGATKRGPGGSS
eukprot:scaffold446_cov487-Pavlova_lutheri.AAC.1